MEIILIKGKNSFETYSGLVMSFGELYMEMFPLEEEREPFDCIVDRLRNGVKPDTVMSLAVNGDLVIGGCIADYYPECQSIEPIYMAVRPEYRKRGIGKTLFESAVSMCEHRHVFIEVDNPETVTESVMDPSVRLKMYEKMGFEKVPVQYRQPPLGEGQQWCDTLILMHRGEPLTKESLTLFLKYFFIGLGYYDTDEYDKLIESVKNSVLSDYLL